MGHCGRGQSDDSILLSLRDPFNKPHVTIDYDTVSENILQIKGKGNNVVDAKYTNYVFDLLNSKSLHVNKITEDFKYILKNATSDQINNCKLIPESFKTFMLFKEHKINFWETVNKIHNGAYNWLLTLGGLSYINRNSISFILPYIQFRDIIFENSEKIETIPKDKFDYIISQSCLEAGYEGFNIQDNKIPRLKLHIPKEYFYSNSIHKYITLNQNHLILHFSPKDFIIDFFKTHDRIKILY